MEGVRSGGEGEDFAGREEGDGGLGRAEELW